MLASAAGAFEALIDAGGALRDTGGRIVRGLRLPALTLALVGLAVSLQRKSAGAGRGTGALVVACVAQSYLLDGQPGLGIALYALAAGACLARAGAPAPLPRPDLPRPLELALLLGLLAGFAALCSYRLDLFPDLYFDEKAFVTAARMQLGQLEAGEMLAPPLRGLYPFERFQAQTLPLLLHAAAVGALGPGVVPTRLVSVAACVLALLCFACWIRPRLGAAAALCAVALAALSPLLLAIGRTGQYFPISPLHAVGCAAALLRFGERRDAASGASLGALLGASIYLYQASWFVPLFCGAALLWRWPFSRAREALASLAVVGAAAAMVALPSALWLREGLAVVGDQTFDRRAVWSNLREDSGPRGEVLLVLPDATREDALRDRLLALRERGLRAEALAGAGRPAALLVSGPDPAIAEIAASEGPPPWLRRSQGGGPLGNLVQMLDRLFLSPGWESHHRLVDAPLLGPLFAPLLVLGAVAAWRRRREPVWCLLLVFGLGGTLLPAVVGGVLPRRAVLMFPFAQALAALPLLEIAGTAGRRRATALAAFAGVALLAATGSHVYFRHWHVDLREWEPREAARPAERFTGSQLELAKLIRTLPVSQPVLMPHLFRGFQVYLRRVEREPPEGATKRVLELRAPSEARALACRLPTPAHLVVADLPSQRALAESLAPDFELRAWRRGAYRIYTLRARRPGGCRTRPLAG